MAIGRRPDVSRLLGKDISLDMKDGKIAAAGTRDDFAGNARSVIDLKGNTVSPVLQMFMCMDL